MGFKIKHNDVPEKIRGFLEDQLPNFISKNGMSFSVRWPPREYYNGHGVLLDVQLGSGLINLYGHSFQNPNHSFCEIRGLESLHKYHATENPNVEKIAHGQGFEAVEEAQRPRAEAAFVFKKLTDKVMKRRLGGFYHITQPDCLVIGHDVYDILDRLGMIEPSRCFKIKAIVEGSEERIGDMYLFDPEPRPDAIDLERSDAVWNQWPDEEWSVSIGAQVFNTSYLPGKSVSIARSCSYHSAWIISKDLVHTLRKHGVKLPKHDGHEVYFGFEYQPKDLLLA